MINSVSKRFTRVADFRGRLAQLSAGLFTLFLVVSCAGNGEPLTNPEPKAADGDSPATAAQNYYDYSEAPAASAQAGKQSMPEGTIGNSGFSFKFPGGDWTMIGGEDGAPARRRRAHEPHGPRPHGNAEPGI